jgi:hypothetical protein
MANASVLQAVNRATVAQALQQARLQSAEHQAWLNAINRASLFLAAEQWQFDGETLIIASATTEGTRYHVTAHTCECRAGMKGRPCWHRAAARLLVKASEIAYTAATTNGYQDAPSHPFEDAKPSSGELAAAVREFPKSFIDLQAAADELFA